MVAIFIIVIYPSYKAEENFINASYSFKIDSIVRRPNQRGHPHLIHKEGDYFVSVQELKIVPYIKQGDSIVKKKGTALITVWRAGENGKLVSRIFE